MISLHVNDLKDADGQMQLCTAVVMCTGQIAQDHAASIQTLPQCRESMMYKNFVKSSNHYEACM